MVIAAGTAIEHADVAQKLQFGINFNIGLSSKCPLKSRCADRCALIQTLPNVPDMSPEMRDRAIDEILDAGSAVRHLVACEWEPLSEPAALKRLLQEYHRRASAFRPQAVGVITSGLYFHHAPFLSELPLDWALVSLDGEPETHARGLDLWKPAWDGLVRLQKTGGARVVGVNTVLGNATLESTISLAKRLLNAGVRYMGVGPYLDIEGQRLVSQISVQEILRVYEALTEALSKEVMGRDFTVMFEMPHDVFQLISGTDPYSVVTGPWRLEHRVPGSVVVAAAINPSPGRFFRLRADSQIIDHADLLTVGVLEGRYGRYDRPGKITELISSAHEAWREGRSWKPESLIVQR